MKLNLIKIIGSTLIVGGTMLALNAYPALIKRINEIREEVRINPDYQPSIRTSDFLIGETGLT